MTLVWNLKSIDSKFEPVVLTFKININWVSGGRSSI